MNKNKTESENMYASMHEVVMKKDELLTKLIQNKAKHDTILQNAIQGYWNLAKDTLATKVKQLEENINGFKQDVERDIKKMNKKIEKKEVLPNYLSVHSITINPQIDLQYPQDHSQDYNRAISMMESSIFDEVKLTTSEYDSYVLNNWEWKNQFLGMNKKYLSSMASGTLTVTTGCFYPMNSNPKGYEAIYREASNNTANILNSDSLENAF